MDVALSAFRVTVHLYSEKAEQAQKKRFSSILTAVNDKGRKNVRHLCAIAGVSPKCFYAYKKGDTGRIISDRKIASRIREVQESTDYAMGYRPMTRIISEEMGRTISHNRIKRIMKDEDLQSRQRRRKVNKGDVRCETMPPGISFTGISIHVSR